MCGREGGGERAVIRAEAEGNDSTKLDLNGLLVGHFLGIKKNELKTRS